MFLVNLDWVIGLTVIVVILFYPQVLNRLLLANVIPLLLKKMVLYGLWVRELMASLARVTRMIR